MTYDDFFEIKSLLINLTTSSVLTYRKVGEDCWEELHLLAEEALQELYKQIEGKQVPITIPEIIFLPNTNECSNNSKN